MKIALTGASGLVGSSLRSFLAKQGHEVFALVRRPPKPSSNEIFWQPATGEIDGDSLEGFDAVIHLAGENIAAARWTPEQKCRIRESRVQGTRLLSQTLAALQHPPQQFLVASATGYYGDRGEAWVDEASTAGSGFLSEVCQEWEAAAEVAASHGIRVVHLRLGVVLSAQGGALAKMLTPFQLGVGGVIGSGKQFMSWVALDDVLGAFDYVLGHETMASPVNVVAPQPVTNQEFTKTLGHVLGRPTLFPMPAFAAKLAFGEMAEALLLAGTKVKPSRLLAAGYSFRYPSLQPALADLLKK